VDTDTQLDDPRTARPDRPAAPAPVRKALKILALGWYDRLNAGDDRIRYAISHLFEPHPVTFLNLWSYPVPFDLLREQDWVIVGGGGLWVGRGMGLISTVRRWHPRIRARLGVLGISVENLEPHREATEYLLEHAEFFHTRDSASAEALACPERVETYADLTFGVPYDREDGPRQGVLVSVAGNFSGDPIDWGILGGVLRDAEARGLPLNEWESDDRAALESLGLPSAPRFDINALASAELVVTSRFHAIVFCIQVGTPFIALAGNRKIENICRDLGFEDWLVPAFDPEALAEQLRSRRPASPRDFERLAAARARAVELAKRQRQAIRGLIEAREPRRYDLLHRAKHGLLRRIS
jgi:hypothetical protein